MTVLKWMKVNGRPADECLTEGQLVIFAELVLRKSQRIEILCGSQYGKSLVVGMACVVLTCIMGLDVVVVAPSGEKASIIMRYFIEHLGDHQIFYSRLERKTRLERLQLEESKKRVKLNNGGSMMVISTDEKNSGKNIESAMGQGGTVTILDEACLVSDQTEATVFRMIAGKPDSTYVKIGNPFYSAAPYSHFYNSWLSDRYRRIFIDYRQALAECRYGQDFIDEAKTKPLFDILFGCEFPPADTMDMDGYRPICLPTDLRYGVTVESILAAIGNAKLSGNLHDTPKLGVDVSAGGDETVVVLRWGRLAATVAKVKLKDTMALVPVVLDAMERCGVDASDTFIDDIGIGRGLTDRLHELGHSVNGVSVGDPALLDTDTFANLKAELCWALKLWIADGTLDRDDDWVQLTWLKYRVLSDRKVQMEPKDKVRARHKRSPDSADALMLTFAQRPFVGFA